MINLFVPFHKQSLLMSLQDSLTIGYMAFATGMILFSIFVLQYVLMQSEILMDIPIFVEAIESIAIFDYVALSVVVASTLASTYLASRINANPLFLPISGLFLGLAVLISYMLTRIPQEMAEHMVVAEIFESAGLTAIVLSNLHIFVLVSGLIGMVATYALTGGRRAGGGRRAPL